MSACGTMSVERTVQEKGCVLCTRSRGTRRSTGLPQGSGVEAGVGGTPAFFINGEKLEGAWPYEKFREVIERALAAAEE